MSYNVITKMLNAYYKAGVTIAHQSQPFGGFQECQKNGGDKKAGVHL